MSHWYPVYLDLRGRRCVVIGGGELALEKVEGLLRAEADITLVAGEPVPALRDLAGQGRLRWTRRGYRSGDLAGARLAIDAGGDDEVSAAVAREAEARSVSLNVVDRTRFCDWIAPAVVRRGPLQIAVSTGGESPFLASSVRARLERLFGEEWGPFTGLTGRLRRRLRKRRLPISEQTEIYRRLLRSPARSQLRAGRTADAEFTAAALAGGRPRGRVTLAGAGPGDPGLLTLAAQEAIFEADLVLHDALVEPAVLALRGPHTELVDVGKRAGGRGPRQAEITERLLAAAREGLDVVRLKGGDPFVFGRGGEELQALLAAGVEVRVIPGVSSATAAPALAGIPLTMRERAASVAFVTARTAAGVADLERASLAADTLVVLMAGGDLDAVAARLAAVLGGSWPAALVARASLSDQQVVRCDLDGAAAAARAARLPTPALLVVGKVAAPLAGTAPAADRAAESSS